MKTPETSRKTDEVLERLSPERREFLKRLIGVTAFAGPAIASFSVDTLSAYEAHAAQGSNLPPV
jgi:hypothetical protein